MEERQDRTGQGERQRGSGGPPTTITEFLLARIAEDEAVARAALPVPDLESPRWLPANLKRRFGFISGYEVDHMARHDPARILAECAAKLAIIEHADKVNALEPEFTDYVWQGALEMNTPKLGDQILRTLASVYADHPGYQQEWAV